MESLVFDLGMLRAATNNFSDANKLGEGGFGPVYKVKTDSSQRKKHLIFQKGLK